MIVKATGKQLATNNNRIQLIANCACYSTLQLISLILIFVILLSLHSRWTRTRSDIQVTVLFIHYVWNIQLCWYKHVFKMSRWIVLPYMQLIHNIVPINGASLAISKSGRHWSFLLFEAGSGVCVNIECRHRFRWWLVAFSMPSHHLNQCWPIVRWTLRNKYHLPIVPHICVSESGQHWFR